jgi:hypothetical protein
LFKPKWSDRTETEIIEALVEVRGEHYREKIVNRIDAMNNAFEEARVSGWEPFVSQMTLPDPDDRHVVASALVARADVIVTRNLDDFPEKVLHDLELGAISPDQFLLDLLDLSPSIVLAVLREQAEHMRHPDTTIHDLLGHLSAGGAPDFSEEVRRLLD